MNDDDSCKLPCYSTRIDILYNFGTKATHIKSNNVGDNDVSLTSSEPYILDPVSVVHSLHGAFVFTFSL